MFVNFPNPDEYAKRLVPGENAVLSRFQVERAMRELQHFTIMALAVALDSTSIKIEVQKRTVTPEDLRQAAGQLRGYATKVEACDPLPKGPAESVDMHMVQPEPEAPSCHVCGALMVPIRFQCRSCGAHTGAS